MNLFSSSVLSSLELNDRISDLRRQPIVLEKSKKLFDCVLIGLIARVDLRSA